MERHAWKIRRRAVPLENVFKLGLSGVTKERPYAYLGCDRNEDVGARHYRKAYVPKSKSKYTPTGKRLRKNLSRNLAG